MHANSSITITVDEGVSHGTIFYGKLTTNRYYNLDGVAVTYKVNGEDYATQFLRSGAAATKPDDPTKYGYMFIGWYDGDTAYDFTTLVTGNITLAAKWAKLSDKTADFTAPDGGAAAITLLNSTKNGAESSIWNGNTKTLTLKGVSFATTATTAVKLPDGATVILADGTENHIIGGGATATQNGTHNNKIYVYGIYAAGALTVQGETNGKLTAESISEPNKLVISNSTVASGRINANTVELQSGSLTIREPVYKNEYTNVLYASHAIYCKNLTVSGGTLDAAWDWGEYTPAVFPVDSYWDYAEPLIKVLNGTSSFSGGTVILDTGCAGNTAIKTEKLNLSGGVRGSGYTNEDGSDTYIQKDGGTPVKFVVYPADYTQVDTALGKVKKLDENLYKDFSAVEAAINAVVRDKNLDEQSAVDAMAKAIEDAINALEKKPADIKPEPSDKSPQTGNSGNIMLWAAVLLIGGVCTVLTLKRKKLYRHGGNEK